MLKISLHLKPGSRWQWTDGRWTNGVSTVDPYKHPMLEHAAVSDGRSTFIVVRERARDAAPLSRMNGCMTVDTRSYRRLVAEMETWPLDFVLVECRSGAEFRLVAGQWGTAPMYLTDRGGTLAGSWSLPDLRQHLRADGLDPLSVTRHLTERTRYTHETLYQGVHMLTERARATYDSSGLTLHYPAPAEHARPRPIRDGIDIIAAYERRLADAVYARPFQSTDTAVELSGGMDSAAVAMTLAEQHRSAILAYALAIGGDAGPQQARRRAAMLKSLGFRDLTINALPLAPFSPQGQRMHRDFVEPGAEPYFEAVGAILDAARAEGARTVFTGDGGDELVSLRGDEWAAAGKVPGRFATNDRLPPWLGRRCRDLVDAVDDGLAPQTVINEATLLGFALRSPQFLDAGIWPVSPLCSPRLIRFAEQLPAQWRDDKRICRERLRRLGFSEDVVRPALRENFRHVMEHGMRHHGMPLLARLAADAITVDLGFVDGDGLRAAVERWSQNGRVDTMMYPMLSLELALRALTSERGERKDMLCT